MPSLQGLLRGILVPAIAVDVHLLDRVGKGTTKISREASENLREAAAVTTEVTISEEYLTSPGTAFGTLLVSVVAGGF